MDERQIHGRIEQLVAEEHELWEREARVVLPGGTGVELAAKLCMGRSRPSGGLCHRLGRPRRSHGCGRWKCSVQAGHPPRSGGAAARALGAAT
jgi:hypothetical protein